MVNSLANHGLYPRDGRNVHAGELAAAMSEVGISTVLGHFLPTSIFLGAAYKAKCQVQAETHARFERLCGISSEIPGPWHSHACGMREPGQKDSSGKDCLNLDQLRLPSAIEHDISLTRRDHQQGDNANLCKLTSSMTFSPPLRTSGKTLSASDLASFPTPRDPRAKRDKPCLGVWTSRA